MVWGPSHSAMETHLRLIVMNGQPLIDASERAAKSRGFAAKWGGHQVCNGLVIISKQEICPNHGLGTMWRCFHFFWILYCCWHPGICPFNKWAMDPEKALQILAGHSLFPSAKWIFATHHSERMPCGLKNTWSNELFPKSFRVGCGISWQLLGDGSQGGFKIYPPQRRLVFWWAWTDLMWLSIAKSISCQHTSHGLSITLWVMWTGADNSTWKLCGAPMALLVPDEMTSQAMTSHRKCGSFKTSINLRKKGVGCGLHRVIYCVNSGWLDEVHRFGVWQKLRRLLDWWAFRQTGKFN